MKKVLFKGLLFAWVISFVFIKTNAQTQTRSEDLGYTIMKFHEALVRSNLVELEKMTHEDLSYGHSNGLIETKEELRKNIETGFIVYRSYKEDSMQIRSNGGLATARFIADIEAILNGKPSTYHLKVMEVWVKKDDKWVLFARHASR